jgi:hypothetical protein
MTCAILASGESMCQSIADSVRGRCLVIVVSDAYKLAPWADALVSMDGKWWRHHKPDFSGRRFSGVSTSHAERVPQALSGWNSGLLAMRVAVDIFHARRVLLLGFDMRGTHFFGKHPEPLRNTPVRRFEEFKHQFRDYRPKDVEIFNCTPGSALTCYATANVEDMLESVAQPALHAA